jgi:hypothetical protein
VKRNALPTTRRRPLQTRILQGVADGYYTVLIGAHETGAAAEFLNDTARSYLGIHARIAANLEQLDVPVNILNIHRDRLAREVRAIGYPVPKSARANATDVIEWASGTLRWQSNADRSTAEAHPPRNIDIGTTETWIVTAFGSKARPAARVATVQTAPGTRLRGLAIDAALTDIETGRRAAHTTHFGRVHAQRTLDAPVAITPEDSVYLHLHATGQVPVTVYLEMRGRWYRSDIRLEEGEQIVRVALENFREGTVPAITRNATLTAIGLDIWPQDNFYPYATVTDVTVALFDVQVREETPDPEWLPHADRSIWLAAFRPNVLHGEEAVPRIALEAEAQDMSSRQVDDSYRRSRREAYRTFTPYRALFPLYAISVDDERDTTTAEALAAELTDRFGVTLPIRNEVRSHANSIRLRRGDDDADGGSAWLRSDLGHVSLSLGAVTDPVGRWLTREAAGGAERLSFLHEWYVRTR